MKFYKSLKGEIVGNAIERPVSLVTTQTLSNGVFRATMLFQNNIVLTEYTPPTSTTYKTISTFAETPEKISISVNRRSGGSGMNIRVYKNGSGIATKDYSLNAQYGCLILYKYRGVDYVGVGFSDVPVTNALTVCLLDATIFNLQKYDDETSVDLGNPKLNYIESGDF